MSSQPDWTVTQLTAALDAARAEERAHRDRAIAHQLESYQRVTDALARVRPAGGNGA
jgi:hypothetical protein